MGQWEDCHRLTEVASFDNTSTLSPPWPSRHWTHAPSKPGTGTARPLEAISQSSVFQLQQCLGIMPTSRIWSEGKDDSDSVLRGQWGFEAIMVGVGIGIEGERQGCEH